MKDLKVDTNLRESLKKLSFQQKIGVMLQSRKFENFIMIMIIIYIIDVLGYFVIDDYNARDPENTKVILLIK